MPNRENVAWTGRIPREIQATIQVVRSLSSTTPAIMSARIVDIGSSGVKVVTEAALDRGSRVQIRVRRPRVEERIELGADVEWSRLNATTDLGAHTSGLTFNPGDEHAAEALLALFFARYVEPHPPLSDIASEPGPEARHNEMVGGRPTPNSLEVTLRATSPYQGQCPGVVEATVVDVGVEGVKIITREQMERGWRLVLRAEVPLLRAFTEVSTEVAWCRPDESQFTRRYASGLSFDPPGQMSATVLMSLFVSRMDAPRPSMVVPPVARIEDAPPISSPCAPGSAEA